MVLRWFKWFYTPARKTYTMPHFDTKGIPWGSFGVPRGRLGGASGISGYFPQTRWKLHPQFRAKVSSVSRLHPESSHPEFIPGAPRSVAQTPPSTGAGDRIPGVKQPTSNYCAMYHVPCDMWHVLCTMYLVQCTVYLVLLH